MFRTKITKVVKNIFLFIIIEIIIIFGINPKNGGIPAIDINVTNKIKLLILLNFMFEKVWKMKFTFIFCIIFVPLYVIKK